MKYMLKLKRAIIIMILTLTTLFMTGCLYPQSELRKNEAPNEVQVEQVQLAVEKFQEANDGILPIKQSESNLDLFNLELLDFTRLVPQYLAEEPDNSFESGGSFQYVIIDADTEPQTKLLDLRVAETIREIKLLVQAYGQPPFKERIADNVFTLNFEKLGYKEDPTVQSPYTNNQLNFVVSGDGEVYVDYLNDIFEKLSETASKETNYKHGDDIRRILIDDSLFVPAYSLPYTLDENLEKPIFLTK